MTLVIAIAVWCSGQMHPQTCREKMFSCYESTAKDLTDDKRLVYCAKETLK